MNKYLVIAVVALLAVAIAVRVEAIRNIIGLPAAPAA